MFEVEGLGRRATLAASESWLAGVMRAEAEQLVLAGHWADLHDPACLPAPETELEVRRRRLNGEDGVQPGGEGTPQVLAFCFAELGVVLASSAGGAKHLVADALDLLHRLPRWWVELQAGRVRGWQARRVAQATRQLPRSLMVQVDVGLAGLLSSLSWSRFEAVLEATVMRADPVGAAHGEAEAGSRRFVSLGGGGGGRGLKTLIARGEVLDIVTFLAAVNRVADLLGLEGDVGSVEVRRSKAVEILGQPDQALALLVRHQHDEDRPPAPVEPCSPGGWRRPSSSTSEPDGAEPPAEDEPGEPDEPAAEAGPDEAGEPDSRSLDFSKAAGGHGLVVSVRAQLYVHLTDAALSGQDPQALCRLEGVGPVTVGTVRDWLRRPAKVTVRPVTVPGGAVPVDGYEIPRATREAVLLRNPASVFPWSWCTDRHALQLDHVRAYLAQARGGPPGQTDPDNLAPLVGTEHQHKTTRRWQERSPAPGVHLWRSPHGWIELVTNQGTFPSATPRTPTRSGAPQHRPRCSRTGPALPDPVAVPDDFPLRPWSN